MSVASGIHFCQWNKFQASTVDTVAQAASVFGAVIEDVAQVRIGGVAAYFDAVHVVAEIVVLGDGGFGNGAGKTGPAAA